MNRTGYLWNQYLLQPRYFGQVTLPYWGYEQSNYTSYYKIGIDHTQGGNDYLGKGNWTYLYVRTSDNVLVFSELRTNLSYAMQSTIHYFQYGLQYNWNDAYSSRFEDFLPRDYRCEWVYKKYPALRNDSNGNDTRRDTDEAVIANYVEGIMYDYGSYRWGNYSMNQTEMADYVYDVTNKFYTGDA